MIAQRACVKEKKFSQSVRAFTPVESCAGLVARPNVERVERNDSRRRSAAPCARPSGSERWVTSQSCPARAKAQARSLGLPRTPSTSQGCPHTCERRSSSLRLMKRTPRRDGRTPGGIPGSPAAHTCEPCLMQVRAVLGSRPGRRAQGAAVRSDGSTAAPVPDAARPEREAASGQRVCRSWLPHALPHSVRTGYPHTPTQGNTITLKRRQGAHAPGQIFQRSTELHKAWNKRWAVLTAQELHPRARRTG